MPRERNAWRQEQGLTDRFVVMYAGNLGRAYDFAPLLRAAEALTPRRSHGVPLPSPASGRGAGGEGGNESPVTFAFVGAGYREGEIRAAAARLSNVVLLPPQPEARLSEVLCAGDVHVVPLRPGAEAVMWPHKVDALVRLGLPVLAVGWGKGVDGVQIVEAERLAEEIRQRAEVTC